LLRRTVFALALLLAALPACAQDLPLARFELSPAAPADLRPLLERVLAETLRVDLVDAADTEDDERLLRRLRSAAADVLATEGYFAVRFETQRDAEREARHLLRVDPGPRTRVGTVDLSFRGPLAQDAGRVEALRSGWELGTGRPFRSESWSAAKARLLARVQERDFPTARIVDSSAEVNTDAASASLRVVIDSGPAFTLGELQLRGLVRYDSALVQRYNPIVAGEAYDSLKLLDLQRRLQASPYFARVTVEPQLDPQRPDRVPIVVEVTEAQRKRIAIGVGVSTETGPRLEATYRQTQVFGFPYTLLTGAGIDRTRTVAFADILLPPKPGGALDSVGALVERTDIENVITSRWAAGVARVYSTAVDGIGIDTKLSINLQRESREIRDDSGVPTPPDVNDVLSTTYDWTRRTVNSITDPRTGDVLTLSGSVGLRRAGTSDLLSRTFLRAYGRYLRYFELSPADQLILRGEAGHVITDDPSFVPNEFLFRTGGAGSVRGYAYQSLGRQQGAATLGSTSLVAGSIEYIRWFYGSWGAAFFYDVGDADNDLMRIRWARGYGAGARWRTLAGPIALDVAYGERDQRWRVHFAISIAF
jgi:translocation and assembly module TamA